MESRLPLAGKTVLITGATSGIGLAAAHALAKLGAVILGAGRSLERGLRAKEGLLAENPVAQVEYFTADLSSQRQVRRLAQDIRQYIDAHLAGVLDVLVNNAGMVSSRYTTTEDGYETTFAVNHLAPFLLTHELLPVLRAAPAARILTVSSGSHRNMRILWRQVMLRRYYNILLAYKQSKLANVLFSAEFNRRLAGSTSMRAFAVEPGLVNTEIGMKNNKGLVYWAWNIHRKQGAPPQLPAKTIALLASEPNLDPPDGLYWRDMHSIPPSHYALRADEASKLWQLSAHLCGLDTQNNWDSSSPNPIKM